MELAKRIIRRHGATSGHADGARERAKKLATLFRGEAVPFDQMIERLANIDIVISSTESPEAIIRARDFCDVLKRSMMKQLDQLFAEV